MTGLLGVLVEDATRGLLDLATTIDQLTKTNFRYSPGLLKSVWSAIIAESKDWTNRS